MLYLKYGSYSHELAEAAVSISQSRRWNEEGILDEIVNTWDVKGILQADDVAALTTAINELEAAYLQNDQEAAIRTQNGFTSHRLLPSQWDSIRCTDLNYPVGDGAEYTSYRSYTLRIEAKKRPTAADGGDPVIEFSESIEILGNGGPDWMFQAVTSGDWPAATLTEKTPITVVQSGSAVGAKRYIYGVPIFPQAEKGKLRRSMRQTPQRRRPDPSKYPSSWSYTYEFMGGTPQIPNPAIDPV